MRALQESPNARYPTIGEFTAALDRALTRIPGGRRFAYWRRLPTGGLGLLVVALAIASISAWPRPGRPRPASLSRQPPRRRESEAPRGRHPWPSRLPRRLGSPRPDNPFLERLQGEAAKGPREDLAGSRESEGCGRGRPCSRRIGSRRRPSSRKSLIGSRMGFGSVGGAPRGERRGVRGELVHAGVPRSVSTRDTPARRPAPEPYRQVGTISRSARALGLADRATTSGPARRSGPGPPRSMDRRCNPQR